MFINCAPQRDYAAKDFLIEIFKTTFDRQGNELIPKSQGSFDFTSENGKNYQVEFLQGVEVDVGLTEADLDF